MKKLFYLFVVAMCATMFTACSKDDDTDPFDAGEDGIITMTVDEEYVNFEVGTAKVGEIITIDWGDGQTQEYKSVKVVDDEEIWHGIEAEHTYSQTSTHAIKVTGAITKLGCYDNYFLTTLDVSKCTTLKELDCIGYLLTSLDVSKNTALTSLNCDGNKLASLDVSKCTALTELWCPYNELTSLNINGCTTLSYLGCSHNKLTSKALNKIFTDLPKGKTWTDEDGYTYTCQISISDNPGSDTCNKSIAENKGWEVYN